MGRRGEGDAVGGEQEEGGGRVGCVFARQPQIVLRTCSCIAFLHSIASGAESARYRQIDSRQRT